MIKKMIRKYEKHQMNKKYGREYVAKCYVEGKRNTIDYTMTVRAFDFVEAHEKLYTNLVTDGRIISINLKED